MTDHTEGTVLKTLVITDLVSSTKLTEEWGDERTSEIIGKQDRLARDLLAEHEGVEIDKTDGFLLFFQRPIEAVRFGLAYHIALDKLSQDLGVTLESRVGIHLGEVVIRRNSDEDIARGANVVEVEGLAKPFTARLMSLAVGRQTLLSSTAFDMARRAAVGADSDVGELRWLAHGGYLLKGVEEPVEVYEVGVEGFAPLSPPPDSEKVQRVGDSDTVLGWRPAPGQEIPRRPRWFVQEKLGEGGFGEVWLAEHSKTKDKRVFKFCYETERLQALQREVTLFRLLKEDLGERGDINRILDWNFDEAPYFLESEYTSSGSLLQWAEQEGGLESIPLETRLDLLAQTAEALAAAHSVGVLHKDIKPGNVLIHADRDGGPRISLADFGIGLVTDETRLENANITVLGMAEDISVNEGSTGLGTQLYMAPELVEGRLPTVQADIYALGVMLYQLVVGDFSRSLAPGWERGIEDELLRDDIAAAVDGSPRRRVGNALRIAERLRSLEERRAEREVERLARAQEERNRRRRKIGWVAAAASSVLLVVMSVFAVLIYREQQRAEENLRLAKAAVDEMLTELGSEALADIPQMEEVRRELLGKARTFYLEFQKRQPSDPGLRMEPALAHRRLGDISRLESDIDAADLEYRTAIELLAGLVENYSDRVDYREELASTHNWRGELLRDHEQHRDAAKASYGAALEVQSALVDEFPDQTRYGVALARTHNNLGILLQSTGDDRAAERSYREAIERLEALVQEGDMASSNPDYLRELSRCYNNLGGLLAEAERTAEARQAFEWAVEALETLRAADPGKRDVQLELAMSTKNLAFFLYGGEQLSDAMDHSRKARGFFADLARPISSVSGEYAHSYWVEGRILREQGRDSDSRESFQRSIDLSREVTTSDSDYAQSGTFHVRFAWLRWVEMPITAGALARMNTVDRAAVCRDYTWLANDLSGEELAAVLVDEDYEDVSGVLQACDRIGGGLVTGETGGDSGAVAECCDALETFQRKFNEHYRGGGS